MQAVKQIISMRSAMVKAANAFNDERGAKAIFCSHVEASVKGLLFEDDEKIPQFWKKPDETGLSEPYKNSEEMTIMRELPKGQN